MWKYTNNQLILSQTNPIFIQLNTLKFKDVMDLNTLQMIYKVKNVQLPEYPKVAPKEVVKKYFVLLLLFYSVLNIYKWQHLFMEVRGVNSVLLYYEVFYFIAC